MKHRLTPFNLQIWILKRKGEWRRDGFNLSGKACRVIGEVRHTIMQGSRDLKRRGLSNREGSRNRRWRAYEATLKMVDVVEWPSMRVYKTLA